MLADGDIPREVEQKRRFPNAGAGGDDDEVASLEAAEQRVKIHEAGAHRGDQEAVGGLAWILEELVEQVAETLEVAGGLGAADAEEQPFGNGKDPVGVGATLVGKLCDLAGGLDQAAVERVAGDDAGVSLDADGGEVTAGHLHERRLSPHRVEVARAVKFVGERGDGDRLTAVGKRLTRLVAPTVLLAKKVLRLKDGEDARIGVLVQEERGDDRLFGADVMRRKPRGRTAFRPERSRPTGAHHGWRLRLDRVLRLACRAHLRRWGGSLGGGQLFGGLALLRHTFGVRAGSRGVFHALCDGGCLLSRSQQGQQRLNGRLHAFRRVDVHDRHLHVRRHITRQADGHGVHPNMTDHLG